MATETCTCSEESKNSGHWRLTNPLCPIHGGMRDIAFVMDSKDDYITAIEDAIEELDKEQERQARLIAAAPELLEALEAARWYVEVYDTRASNSEQDAVLTQIDMAIAKARGQP